MEKRIQLFLLPFAGGSSLSFMRLNRFLDPCIEAITIEYVGRGKRNEEAYISNYNAFVDDVICSINNNRDFSIPYAILGYSMGSVIAYDIIKSNILDQPPKHYFACAEGSLIAPNPVIRCALLDDENFYHKIIALGGIDSRLLHNKVALTKLLKLIKSDYKILAQYVYDGGRLDVDTSVIYSPTDKTCIRIGDWKDCVLANVNFYTLGDNHFFINQCYREMAQIINSEVMRHI